MQRESLQSTSFPFVPSTISVSCRFSRSYEAASLDEFQRVWTFDVIHLSSSFIIMDWTEHLPFDESRYLEFIFRRHSFQQGVRKKRRAVFNI